VKFEDRVFASASRGILWPMRQETSSTQRTSHDTEDETTTCPRCGESHELAKVKGCLKCLKCGFKFDCNGW
jgi:ribosomal protein S27AE